MRLIGVVLVALGVAALVYGGFEYKSRETVFQLGPIEATTMRDKRVDVPVWAGAASVGVGTLLLLLGGRRRRS